MSPRGAPGVPRPRPPKPLQGRFMAMVKVVETGCWEWQGYVRPNGYGYFRHPETTWAHRVSHMIFKGPIPDGLHIDHLCRNKRCVNPEHLDPVTPSVNQRRATAWTTCQRFHPSEPSRFALRSDGRRVCLECKRISEQQRRDSRALRAANVLDPRVTNGEGSPDGVSRKCAGQGADNEADRSDNFNCPWVRTACR